jgi:hypothetical protein
VVDSCVEGYRIESSWKKLLLLAVVNMLQIIATVTIIIILFHYYYYCDLITLQLRFIIITIIIFVKVLIT